MQGRTSACRVVLIVCIVLLFLAASCASADSWIDYVLYSGSNYWVYNSSTSQYYTTGDWSSIQPTDVPLVEVQLTIYNEAYTDVIAQMFPVMQGVEGYLYAYSVKNWNYIEDTGSALAGVKKFEVTWQPSAVAMYSHQTRNDWEPYFKYNASVNNWMYGWEWIRNGDDKGLLPGETVGGFWLFANTPEHTPIQTMVNADPVMNLTDGPLIPEPSALIALLSGTIGTLGLAARKRRS